LFQIPPSQLPAAPLPPAGLAILWRAPFKRGRRVDGTPQLPATVFGCAAPGPAGLARYNAALGFAPASLPVTAWYLLAQRAHLATMLAPGFPFRLLGMVHVENAIVEHARVAPGTPLRLVTTVCVEPATQSGARFCVLETTAWDGTVPVFGCVSKYLALAGRKSGTRPEGRPAPALPVFGGWQVGHGDGRSYARLSGDWNPIHLARWTAQLFGLRAPIIHGMHSVARAVALLEAGGKRATSVSVRFRATVPLGSTVRLRHAPDTPLFVLECAGRTAVDGEIAFAPR